MSDKDNAVPETADIVTLVPTTEPVEVNPEDFIGEPCADSDALGQYAADAQAPEVAE